MGFAYLGAKDQPDTPDQLERPINAGMSGLRVELASPRRPCAGFRFDGEREWRIWERLDRLRRPIILDISTATPADVAALRQTVGEFAHLNVLICQVGWPAREGWQERALVAQRPRGWVDLASLPAK